MNYLLYDNRLLYDNLLRIPHLGRIISLGQNRFFIERHLQLNRFGNNRLQSLTIRSIHIGFYGNILFFVGKGINHKCLGKHGFVFHTPVLFR